MAKPQTSPKQEEPTPTLERTLLAVEKTPAGWLVVEVRVVGARVLAEKPLSHPGKAAICIEAFKRHYAAAVLK